MKLKRTDIYAVLVSSLAGYAVLASMEHAMRQWLLHTAGSHAAIRVLPIYTLILIFLIPIFIAAAIAMIIPALSKWNTRRHARAVTFFTILGGYLFIQILDALVTVTMNASVGTVLYPVLWTINALVAVAVGFGVWQYFYAWKSSIRIKLAIAATLGVGLYLVLPLLQNFIYRALL